MRPKEESTEHLVVHRFSISGFCSMRLRQCMRPLDLSSAKLPSGASSNCAALHHHGHFEKVSVRGRRDVRGPLPILVRQNSKR